MKPEWSYDVIAPIYDEDMGINMPFNDIAGYLSLLPPAPAQLLEVGCGTGRLTLPLAACGYAITAIDRSAPMLEQLSHKLTPDLAVTPLHMDARNLLLEGRFDAVFFGYSGFQYLLNDVDIGLFCSKVKPLLTATGSLILDIFLHKQHSEIDNFVLDYERHLAHNRTLRRYKQVSVNQGINTVRRKYVLTCAGACQSYQTQSRQRLYTRDSLIATLGQHGFKMERELFDYQVQNSASNAPRFYTAQFLLSPV